MPIDVGVVGFGYWGSKHARVLSSLPEVSVHVIDTNPFRREQAERTFSSVRTHARLDDAVDLLDGVVIATPPSSHAPLARATLEAGVHTMVEKPLALSSEACVELIETAVARDCTLMAGHTFEYNAAICELRRLLDSGELGRILYVDTARLNLGLYQPDVSVLWDLGPHDVSILNFLLRSTPNRVMATAEAHRGGPHADVAHLQLRYDDAGVTAYSRLSWLDPIKVRRVTVVGSRKMCVNNDVANERLRIFDAGVDPSGPEDRLHEAPLVYRYGDITSPHVPFEEPLLTEDRHFVECVQLGKSPQTDGWCGLEVVRVLEAAERSIAEGRIVDVEAAPALS